ncbi:MAG: bacteriorhodopsin [Candidatus Saccharibacteria bacterium]
MNTSMDWLNIGLWGMITGALAIGLLSMTLRKEDRHHAILAGWITVTAATSYYALTTGFGDLTVNGHILHVARYADWVITTPLLLASLVVVALPRNKSKDRTSILAGIIGLDVFMIVTGLFATLTDNRWPWYIFSCVALVLVAFMLYVVVLNESKKVAGDKITKIYIPLTFFLSVLWFAYPVVWYLAGTGVGTITAQTEAAMYAVLDVTAKAGFGLILLASIKFLEGRVNPKDGESTTEAACK